MALIPGLSSASDLYAKLKRDAGIIDNEVTSDAFFNFVITGYSLIDWIKNDPSISSEAKTESEIKALYEDKGLKICGDLAVAAKHFVLTNRKPIISSATSRRGPGEGRYGRGKYKEGEETITVSLNDGTEFSALELVTGVLNTWKLFFNKHKILEG